MPSCWCSGMRTRCCAARSAGSATSGGPAVAFGTVPADPPAPVGRGVRGDPGDAARLAPATGHPQLELHEPAAARTTTDGSRDPQARDPHRDRQSDLVASGVKASCQTRPPTRSPPPRPWRMRARKPLRRDRSRTPRTGPSWKQCLAAQARRSILAAIDHCPRGHGVALPLRPDDIEHDTRRAHLAGLPPNPDGAWTTQAARNRSLIDLNERAASIKFLISDPAGQFTGSFDAVFTAAGIRILASPPQAPRAKRSGCLLHPFGWTSSLSSPILIAPADRWHARNGHRQLRSRRRDQAGDDAPRA